MANQKTSIMIGGLQTADKFADQLFVVLWADSNFSQPLSSQTSGLVPGGTGKVQSDSIIFSNLNYGQQYWLSVQTIVSSTGSASTQKFFNLIAGNNTVPVVVYTFTAEANTSGTFYHVTPTTYPPDIDHYDYWYNSDGSQQPTSATVPIGSATPDGNNKFSFAATAGGGTISHVWVRAVNTSGLKQVWVNLDSQTIPNQQRYTIYSTGTGGSASGYPPPQIIQNGKFVIGNYAGLNVLWINSSTGNIDRYNTYDFNHDPNAMTAFLNDMGPNGSNTSGHIVGMYVSGDIASGFANIKPVIDTMVAMGASRKVLGSANFKIGAAYILIGGFAVWDGGGLESYSGAVDNDPSAFVTADFYVQDGRLIGSGGKYPPAFQIDAAQNDVSPTGNVPPYISQAFTYTCDTSSITWAWSNLTVYRSDQAGSVNTYTGTMSAISLGSGIKFYFYPFADDNPNDVGIGWYKRVIFVNQVPGGFGNFGNAYGGINYACSQDQGRMDRLPLSSGALEASTTAVPSGGGNPTGGGSDGGSGTCLHEDTIVNEIDLGYVPLSQCNVGYYIEGPNGWVRITDLHFADNELWIGLTFEGSESDGEFLATVTHPWTLHDSDECKGSAQLATSDLIPTKQGVTHPTKIRVVKKLGRKARVTVESEDHLFCIGRTGVVTHNAQMIFPC